MFEAEKRDFVFLVSYEVRRLFIYKKRSRTFYISDGVEGIPNLILGFSLEKSLENLNLNSKVFL